MFHHMIVIFVLCLAFIGCQGSKKKGEVKASNLELPSGYSPPKVLQLTGVGVNWAARFSPNEEIIAYISSRRPSHDDSQVYVKNIKTSFEKRVSFHDGETHGVVFSPDGKRLLYSSTTDEEKEKSDFIKDSLKRITGLKKEEQTQPMSSPFWLKQPLEIYSTSLNGTRIERLTKSPYFDSNPTIDPLDKKMIFVSARNGNLNLHMASTTGTYIRQLSKKEVTQSHPQISPDGKSVAWVEYNKDLTEAHVFVADISFKNIKQITTDKAIHFQPSWKNDSKTLLFSSNRVDVLNYELFSIQSNGECIQRLSWHSSNETEPAFHPNGNSFLFTSDRSGEKQIYLSDFLPPSTCPSKQNTP